MEDKFNEKDMERLVSFINSVAKRAKFDNMSIQEVIELYNQLSFIQKEFLPKLERNLLEVKKIIEPKKEK